MAELKPNAIVSFINHKLVLSLSKWNHQIMWQKPPKDISCHQMELPEPQMGYMQLICWPKVSMGIPKEQRLLDCV